jgi:hypothetical protein
MSNRDYIPQNAVAFVIWLKQALIYIIDNCERWGITAPGEAIKARVERLEMLTDKCTQKEHGPMDTLRRNEARESLERDVRGYIRGTVMYNLKVTDEDRRAMGLPIRDTKPTPVGDPVGLVTAVVKYLNEGALELHIEHVESTPADKRANYGVKIAWDVFPMDAPLPDDPEALRRSTFTRRKKELLTFGSADRRKTAVFCLRYENSKGRAGQWGPVFSAVIP